MAELNPPGFLQSEKHASATFRRMIGGMLGDAEGVVTEALGGLEVMDDGGAGGMGITVRKGRAFITGTEASGQGTYFVENDNWVDFVLSNGDASNPRVDLVIARVQDGTYSGAINEWSLEVLEGAPAGSPVAPSLPDNALALASIAVAANASTVSGGNITDLRSFIGVDEAVTPALTTLSGSVGLTASNLTSTATYAVFGATLNIGQPAAGNYYLEMHCSLSLEQIDGGGSHMENRARLQYSVDNGSSWVSVIHRSASTNKGALDHATIALAHLSLVTPSGNILVRVQRWKEKSNTVNWQTAYLFASWRKAP